MTHGASVLLPSVSEKSTGSRDEEQLGWLSPPPSCCEQPQPGLSQTLSMATRQLNLWATWHKTITQRRGGTAILRSQSSTGKGSEQSDLNGSSERGVGLETSSGLFSPKVLPPSPDYFMSPS